MRKLFLILTIVCLLATVTIINAIPVSAGTLTITPTAGGPEDPGGPHDQPDQAKPPPDQEDPAVKKIELPPQMADEALVKAAELNPILGYVPDEPIPPPPPPDV